MVTVGSLLARDLIEERVAARQQGRRQRTWGPSPCRCDCRDKAKSHEGPRGMRSIGGRERDEMRKSERDTQIRGARGRGRGIQWDPKRSRWSSGDGWLGTRWRAGEDRTERGIDLPRRWFSCFYTKLSQSGEPIVLRFSSVGQLTLFHTALRHPEFSKVSTGELWPRGCSLSREQVLACVCPRTTICLWGRGKVPSVPGTWGAGGSQRAHARGCRRSFTEKMQCWWHQ